MPTASEPRSGADSGAKSASGADAASYNRRNKGAGEPWRSAFLQHLAETSNVSASAAKAKIKPSIAYKLRREDPRFAAEWQEALHEGYEHLEMEVLAYLRGTKAEQKMDVANAIRILAAHRDTVARMRALQDDEDEQAVLDSIDQMIDLMRCRNMNPAGAGEKAGGSHASR